MKRKVLVGNRQYKCRRCGAVCFGEDLVETFAVHRLVKNSHHCCADDGIGILDLVGLSPLHEVLAITRKHRVSRGGAETYLSTKYIELNSEEP